MFNTPCAPRFFVESDGPILAGLMRPLHPVNHLSDAADSSPQPTCYNSLPVLSPDRRNAAGFRNPTTNPRTTPQRVLHLLPASHYVVEYQLSTGIE
jgi:hypothetical protein